MKPIILASGSPRRREMLSEAGLAFEVIPSPAEELHDVNMPLTLLCETNAELKALAVAKLYPEAVVIGADTLVYIDETPLGKPKSKEEAVSTLRQLSGRCHEVCTGVCIAGSEGVHTFHEVTEVCFKTLSEAVITSYMSKVDVMDKAGSYAIQEYGELIIESMQGDYSNVVGLPMSRLLQFLNTK